MDIRNVLLYLWRLFYVVCARSHPRPYGWQLGRRQNNAIEVVDVRNAYDDSIRYGIPLLSTKAESKPCDKHINGSSLYANHDAYSSYVNRRVADFFCLLERC